MTILSQTTASTQAMVLRLNNETLQRIIVGVAEHLHSTPSGTESRTSSLPIRLYHPSASHHPPGVSTKVWCHITGIVFQGGLDPEVLQAPSQSIIPPWGQGGD